MYVEYNSNNSGGRWWLTDQNWKDLEAAGWKVKWASHEIVYDEKHREVIDEDGMPKLAHIEEVPPRFSFARKDKEGVYRNLGALAQYAYRAGLDFRAAVEEWERVTGEVATDTGCPCCGQPHTFTLYDDTGNSVRSGPEIRYSASW